MSQRELACADAVDGDEVFDCGSDVDSGCDSEIDSEPATPRPQIRSSPRPPQASPQKVACPPAVKVRAVNTPKVEASPWQKGALDLAVHLRKDNEQLRLMLVEAQKQAEQAIADGEHKSVDFAHLLDLVKEFGTGLEGCVPAGQMNVSRDPMADALNAEQFRLDDDEVDERDQKIEELEAEVAALTSQLQQDNAGDSDLGAATWLDGAWLSQKSAQLHTICRPGKNNVAEPATSQCTEWTAVEVDALSVTLRGTDGREHTVERLKTRMFGEALLWGHGDLWTLQPPEIEL